MALLRRFLSGAHMPTLNVLLRRFGRTGVSCSRRGRSGTARRNRPCMRCFRGCGLLGKVLNTHIENIFKGIGGSARFRSGLRLYRGLGF